MHGTINEEEPFVQLREMVKTPLKSNQAMAAEDGIIESNIVQIREMTLETSFTKKCHRGEAIRLELPGLEPTLKQIRTALRAAMVGCPHPVFVLTFKTGDRHVVQHQANNPWIMGNENCYHVMMTTDKLNELKER